MPTYDTPEPISVALELSSGAVWITASERTDTVVDVAPSDPSSEADVRDARETRVELSGGGLLVKVPKRRSLFGRGSSVDVKIQLPAGSTLQATSAAGAVNAEGRLGDCRLKVGAGDIRLGETAALRATTGLGDITVDRVGGDVDVSTGSGDVRIREVAGAVRIKNSNGATRLGAVAGELRVRSANGDVEIASAGGAVDAKTALGDLRVDEVVRGSVALQTSAGGVEVGIREGTAAWLDVSSGFGQVRNALESSSGPQGADETVEVRARTSFGDIVIHRA